MKLLILLQQWSLVGVVLTSLAVGVVLAAPTPVENDILTQGSPAYNDLLLQQRNWSGSRNGSSNKTRNETLSATATPCSLRNLTVNPCDDATRDKQLRLQSIQDYVLSTLGRGKVPSTPVGSSSPGQPIISPFSGDTKTFLASCETPNRVDEAVWTDSSYFHLFFKFPQPSRLEPNGTRANSTASSGAPTLPKKPFTTISAKLRIFKVGQDAQNETGVFDPTFLSGSTTQLSPKSSPSSASITTGGSIVPTAEEKIRVSVYWYKAPVTKTHYKKKLLDTRMISVKGSSWIEFDIINAAVPWLDRYDKNFGLVVEVENEDNDPLNPSDYFANLLCPGNSSNTSNLPFLKLSPPPQLQICILSTPHNQREVDTTESPAVPFPHQMSQSFSLLSRMAKAHDQQRAAAAGSNNTNTNTDWQNDDLPPTQGQTKTGNRSQSHRHRHGHGTPKNGRNRQQQPFPVTPTTTGFQLDEDHPLRRILATAATNLASNSNGHVHSRRCHDSDGHLVVDQDDGTSSDDSSETDRDIIIQRVYIRGAGSSATAGDLSPSVRDQRER